MYIKTLNEEHKREKNNIQDLTVVPRVSLFAFKCEVHGSGYGVCPRVCFFGNIMYLLFFYF